MMIEYHTIEQEIERECGRLEANEKEYVFPNAHILFLQPTFEEFIVFQCKEIPNSAVHGTLFTWLNV